MKQFVNEYQRKIADTEVLVEIEQERVRQARKNLDHEARLGHGKQLAVLNAQLKAYQQALADIVTMYEDDYLPLLQHANQLLTFRTGSSLYVTSECAIQSISGTHDKELEGL